MGDSVFKIEEDYMVRRIKRKRKRKGKREKSVSDE